MTGCLMTDSLFIRANGDLACWDDVGEYLILRTISPDALRRGQELDLFDFDELKRIRASFLSGEAPHEICSRCAVRGLGGTTSLRPRQMRILHLEASFICHLKCPLCISPQKRRKLRPQPHNMPISLVDGVLRQLRTEGVDEIHTVHFEGRGDPMMNPKLAEIVTLVRQYYPRATTMVTTHGNVPCRPWMFNGDLDLLRLSVDGATQETYSRYRVGGHLDSVLELMRDIRDQRRQHETGLKVLWRYILFEWNDSDREIREAARLADELDVQLVFLLTSSEGRSKRFVDQRTAQRNLRQLAPGSVVESSFAFVPDSDQSVSKARANGQLTSEESTTDGEHGDRAGILGQSVNETAPDFWAAAVHELENGNHRSALGLFERYQELAPWEYRRDVCEMLDQLRVGLFLHDAQQSALQRNTNEATKTCVSALRIDLGPDAVDTSCRNPVGQALSSAIESCRFAQTLSGLAFVRKAMGDHEGAIALLVAHVKRFPEAPIHTEMKDELRILRRERRMRRATLPLEILKRSAGVLRGWAASARRRTRITRN